MLGYMTKKEAIKAGFTNHGRYYGISLYVRPDGDFMVAAKWYPMEYLITIFHFIEAFIFSVFYPENEPMFRFMVGPEIKV